MSVGVIECFAGPGGWSTGLAMLGRCDTVGVEWDPVACVTARRAGHARVCLDVAALDPVAFAAQVGWTGEGFIASPPCPTFSAAGRGSGRGDIPAILAAIDRIGAGELSDVVLADLRAHCADPRTVLVMEPLRWALALRPAWLALEQVPSVLPIWQAIGAVLGAAGYRVAAGHLQAEQHGVPQTRRRAVLVARLDGHAALPVATHSRYWTRDPGRLDPGVAPWVSMAVALGWGMTRRPSHTVTGGGVGGGGGGEPIGNHARNVIIPREIEQGHWVLRSNYGTNGDPANRGTRSLDDPAPAVTSKVGRNLWRFAGASATSQTTAGQIPRGTDQPAHTITGKGTAAWMPDNLDGPASVRIAVQEAGVLQSFPVDYPWWGTKGEQYRQVGDAVPPLLAARILATVTGQILPLTAAQRGTLTTPEQATERHAS